MSTEQDRAPEGASITPSSLGVFFALDQCQRFLRLALMPRDDQDGLLTAAGVVIERIPPVLSFEGSLFERDVEDELRAGPIRARFPAFPENPQEDRDSGYSVLDRLEAIEPGEQLIFGQDKMSCTIGRWEVNGQPDIVVASRDDDGRLSLLVCDIKASREPRLEHRLQVALYARMLHCLVPELTIEQGVIYRLPANPVEGEAAVVVERDRQAAADRLGIAGALLSIAVEPREYEEMLDRVLLGEGSLAERTIDQPLEALPFHIERKCDVCAYNQLCLKHCRDIGDLSLVPYLGEQDKRVLRLNGVATIAELAAVPTGDPELRERLHHTWPVGAHMGELTERAASYLGWQREEPASSQFLTERGYSTLPAVSPSQHPNLIQIFLDAQLYDPDERLYLLGALVRAHRDGVPVPGRERRIVRMLDRAPRVDSDERELLTGWLIDLLEAIRDLAIPTEEGVERLAPIHLYVFEESTKQSLLGAIQRNASAVFGVESLFRLLTQRAAYDTGNISVVGTEVERQWNLPMLCQSLQAVATFKGFRWDTRGPLRKQFRHRFFDQLGRVETSDEQPLYAPARARFKSDIPIEYAYLAWGETDPSVVPAGAFAQYGSPTISDLKLLEESRLDALAHVVDALRPNAQTTKTGFDLAAIATGAKMRPETTLQAMKNFVVVERHTELNGWRSSHVLRPETRVLQGETLIGIYREGDQELAMRLRLRQSWEKHLERVEAWEDQRADGGEVSRFPPMWSAPEVTIRLEVTRETLQSDPAQAIRASTLKVRSWVAIAPRTTVDTRPDAPSREPYTPTSRQLMLSLKGEITRIVERDERHWVEVELRSGGGKGVTGFTFASPLAAMLVDGESYTLDSNPSSPSDANRLTIIEEIENELPHAFAGWLDRRPALEPHWPAVAAEGQRRFFAGIEAMTGYAFEGDKERYIGEHGADPVLLVQGPPGTGKSFSTAYAVLARIQGAMAAGESYVVAVSCMTHAATDVVVEKVADMRAELGRMRASDPTTFDRYFDERLLDVPVIRWTDGPDWETAPLPTGCRRFAHKTEGARVKELGRLGHAVVGGTPSKIRKLGKTGFKDGHGAIFDLCVIDEASQMSAPDALQATVGLKPTGRVVFVGDHRQMPPIVKHNWDQEGEVTFDPYAMHRSIFDLIRQDRPETPHEKFRRSYRLHRDVAEYLRREIYQQDGIAYHSELSPVFDSRIEGSAMVEAVLNGGHPLIVIRHDEMSSQKRNELETTIVTELYKGLEGRRTSRLEQHLDVGVVVPHRAQRAEIRKQLVRMFGRDELALDVDTVERFQGGERGVIIVSATESDPAYLRSAGAFLFDPRRLTVAISRAREKLIVIAARSVFDFLPADLETLRDTALWRNLPEDACRLPLWAGLIDGHRVEVLGNAALTRPDILA